MLKRIVTMCAAFILCVTSFAQMAAALDCDPAFKGVEAYYCKLGEKEYQMGFDKTSRTLCVEHKKIDITGCDIGPFDANDGSTAYIYLLGTKEQRENFSSNFDIQCDNSKLKHHGAAGVTSSGIWVSRFEGYMHPDYTLDKYPGMSNSDRSDKFRTNNENGGKFEMGGFSISAPTGGEYDTGEQVCQHYSVKTNTIAFRANATFSMSGKGKEAASEGEGKGLKGLKGLFKKK
jgi:hypothetical protein